MKKVQKTIDIDSTICDSKKEPVLFVGRVHNRKEKVKARIFYSDDWNTGCPREKARRLNGRTIVMLVLAVLTYIAHRYPAQVEDALLWWMAR